MTEQPQERSSVEALRLADMNENKGKRLQSFIDDNEFTEFGYRPEGLRLEQSDLFANAAELRRLHKVNHELRMALEAAERRMREDDLLIEWERGACRSADVMEAACEWPAEVYQARAAITKATGGAV